MSILSNFIVISKIKNKRLLVSILVFFIIKYYDFIFILIYFTHNDVITILISICKIWYNLQIILNKSWRWFRQTQLHFFKKNEPKFCPISNPMVIPLVN